MKTDGMKRDGVKTLEEALALFDGLEPVDEAFMIGSWRGEGFATGHPLDGLLEACHWRGKRFESADEVHPLVFATGRDDQTCCVDPQWVGPFLGLAERLRFPTSAAFGRLFQRLLPLLATSRSRARLRLTSYRGQTSATMIYDQLPILDVFRRIDADTVLGVMDRKGMTAPFFFVLRRDAAGPG